MKHPSTRTLFDYWNRRRGNRPAPERGDIDPADIRGALGDTFMLAADFVDELRFRLAGTRVCALFCREIKGESFAAPWNATSRKAIAGMMTAVVNGTEGAVADLTGHAADGAEVKLEMLVLPLAYAGHARIRALGVLAPEVPPYWLGEKPIVEIELGTLRAVDTGFTGRAPGLARLADGRWLRRGLAVHRGGGIPTAELPG